jgi:hypothetical protein
MAPVSGLPGSTSPLTLMRKTFFLSIAVTLFFACVRKPDRTLHYQVSAYSSCVSMATASLDKKQEWILLPDAQGKFPSAPAVFSNRADEKFIKLAIQGRKSIDTSKSFEEKERQEKVYLDALLDFLRRESPSYAAKCDRLVGVYQKCELYFDHPDRFKSCVDFEQKPILGEMNAYLYRNYRP